MKEISVISGKGGTGKTTITASLAQLMNNSVYADCDVDAPNLDLVLEPKVHEKEAVKVSKVAERVNIENCIECNKCRENCRFDAINQDLTINKFKCEGCGVCQYICPNNVIKLQEKESGDIYNSTTRFGPMVYGKLRIGEEATGKIVDKVKEKARKVAKTKSKDHILIDGSPGVGCPVIASINGVDHVLIVTEPTVSGIHDLKRVIELTNNFNLEKTVCINKYDLNKQKTKEITKIAQKNNTDTVKIPYNENINKTIAQGKTIFESINLDTTIKQNDLFEVAGAIFQIWKKIH
ncbi:MAG: MinD superfamily P-loop ATPase containing an inserted ferredoxin domain [Candidatus Methanohalarchaeum thermophilum]|uniref:MinD superfamily P-loop ATPase containing an inserted ferredoxin domain n=1 Tax=Methanohalarchaeum thermophilum TaxID=1903181 RepID=A0A1Q6DSF7_METT1|nr:MAG: MinD superfamily P-loop ATPase containing an inserted ferredoxin domain [Candidatus Methanohalarchaeum thermophilum]